jgi:hypothetical protein
MLKLLKNNRGQNTAVEYVVTFFLVVGILSAMSVYIRRTIQGRMRDAQLYMAKTVAEAAPAGNFTVPYEYEPYYANAEVIRSHVGTQERRQGNDYQLLLDQTTLIYSNSQQFSPRDAGL